MRFTLNLIYIIHSGMNHRVIVRYWLEHQRKIAALPILWNRQFGSASSLECRWCKGTKCNPMDCMPGDTWDSSFISWSNGEERKQ